VTMQNELIIVNHSAGVELHYNNGDDSYYTIVSGKIYYHFEKDGIKEINEITDVATFVNLSNILMSHRSKLNIAIEDIFGGGQ